MSLMISRNGKIQEITRKTHKRVKAPDDNRVEFEDVLDQESGKEHPPQRERQGNENSFDEQTPQSHKALQAYKKNKKTVHSKIIHAKELCSRPVIMANPKQSVREAQNIMAKNRIHHLPLVNEEGVLMGIVSDRDLIGKKSHEKLERHGTKDVLVAKEFIEIKIVAKMMLDNQISALPLIDENNAISGIITKSNLLEYIIQSMPFDRHV